MPLEEETVEPPSKENVISIRFDNDDRDEIIDLANDYPFDSGRDCIRVPPADCSPPSISHSNFNVVEDTEFAHDQSEVDWWNYFQMVDENSAEALDSSREAHQGQKSPSIVSLNKGASSPISTDSFWRVPKAATIPNSDWYLTTIGLLV